MGSLTSPRRPTLGRSGPIGVLPIVVALLSCAQPQTSYRRVGNVTPPPFPPGCPIDVLSSPGQRETVVVGEVRCDPGEGTQDQCIAAMRDAACALGGTALGAGPNEGRVLTATVLRYADTIPGYTPPPPPPPVCDPPCGEREICTESGCAPDPDAPPLPPQIPPEEEEAMHTALDRISRRIFRCLRGRPETTIKANIEVEPSGAVVSVRIEGEVASTDAGACAEEAIFGVQFAAFEGDQNRTVTHEYTQ